MEPGCLLVQLTSQQFIIGQIIALEMLQKAPTAQIQSRGQFRLPAVEPTSLII